MRYKDEERAIDLLRQIAARGRMADFPVHLRDARAICIDAFGTPIQSLSVDLLPGGMIERISDFLFEIGASNPDDGGPRQ